MQPYRLGWHTGPRTPERLQSAPPVGCCGGMLRSRGVLSSAAARCHNGCVIGLRCTGAAARIPPAPVRRCARREPDG